jgi:pentatricopeptide repeat protein
MGKRFLFVTANENETTALLEDTDFFKYEQGLRSQNPNDDSFYNVGKFGCYEIVHFELQDQGAVKAGASLPSIMMAIDAWKPDAVILIGIAFGKDNEKKPEPRQHIGDVLISKMIQDYESGKVMAGKFMSDGSKPESGKTLTSVFQHFSRTWDYSINGRKVKCELGLILSGDKVVDDINFKKRLFKAYPRAIGGEMEGRGAYSACKTQNIHEWIVVKAICDWGGNKNTPDKDKNQLIAARSAVSLLKHVFSNEKAFEKLPTMSNDNIKDNLDKIPKIVTINSAPSPTGYFIGREAEITEIKKYVEENKKIILISGMGGIGKSEICKKLFHEYVGQERNGKIKHIGWVVWNSNLRNTLVGNFQGTSDIENAKDNFKATKKHINDLADKLLLFIDNMNDISKEDETELYNLACNIVITSRLNEVGNLQKIRIGELLEENCVKIYKSILSRNVYDDKIIQSIIKKAARLTLVVELLAKTAKTANLTDEKLLKKLEQNGFNFSEIKKKVDRDKRFNENMSSLFDLSGINSEELSVLKQFSVFPSQPLDFEYAEKWFEQDNPDILNNLVNKGWLIKTEIGFYMHNVISDVVKYENSPKYEECAELIDMVSNALCFDVKEIFTSKLWALPFAEKVAKYFFNERNEKIASLLHNAAKLYSSQADYGKTLDFYDKALKIREELLGKTHPDTATAYDSIAAVYYSKGDCDKAWNFYDKALKIREKELGKEQQATAASYNNIAGVYCSKGNYDKALELYYEALEIRKKVLGEEHPSTAATYSNIAGVYRAQGDYNKALCFYGKALKIRENVLEKEHPSIATTYNNMARVYFNQGNYGKALDFYKKALKIREEKLGKRHPSTARTYNNIAKVYLDQDDYDKALELYVKSYWILFNRFDADHPDSKRFKRDLKKAYGLSSKAEKFETWLREQLSKEAGTA